MVYSEEWLKNTIHEGYFKSYEFSIHKPIGKGGFGIVYKAKWKLEKLRFMTKNCLIADFGLSKYETSKTSNASVHGVQVYIDPQCFENVTSKTSNSSVHGVQAHIYPQCFENVSYKGI
ncbi:hypothetical protein F8M41_010694 [Gigaspora margarita]|uniref:Protein kinase domain-containing protein n=1 Tax=Gigaspora margarita TaxID=4874 RepID=A0A8H3X1T8_GIGMA|nr:hypothetical protein F8M41_010694 [Gigaspora margarita]